MSRSFWTTLAWAAGAVALVAVSLLPIHWAPVFAAPLFAEGPKQLFAKALLVALPPITILLVLRSYSNNRKECWFVGILVLAAACLCEQVHHQFVDKAFYFPGPNSNTVWQYWLQQMVLKLDPSVIPHSYRFLPNGIVGLFQWWTGSFDFARAAYRILFNALLFATIIRYSRVYLSPVATIGSFLLILLTYPITIAWYAGQFADPASHLSFILCFYCLARNNEAGFGASLLTGLFAKESVAALAVTRLWLSTSKLKGSILAGIYLAAAVAVLMGIRLYVNRGSFQYNQISGVGMTHLVDNFRRYAEWGPQYLFTLGILIPGAVAGWRLMDRPFQLTCIFVNVSLIASSILFSWLNEVRNLVPGLVMLSIVNMRYIETRFLQPATASNRQFLQPTTK